jgi:hypothetical protein
LVGGPVQSPDPIDDPRPGPKGARNNLTKHMATKILLKHLLMTHFDMSWLPSHLGTSQNILEWLVSTARMNHGHEEIRKQWGAGDNFMIINDHMIKAFH